MDEEQGKVIDGTARARQWRRSRSKAGAEAASDEIRSDAPKSIASSLLVPADLMSLEVSSTEGGTPTTGDEHVTTPAGKAALDESDHENLFLAAGAAVDGAQQGFRRSRRESLAVLIARSVGWLTSRTSSRPKIRSLPQPLRRRPLPIGRLSRALAVALGCAAAVALGVSVLIQSGSTTPRMSPPSHAGVSVTSLDELKAPLALAALRSGQEHGARAASANEARSVRLGRSSHHRPRTQPASTTTSTSDAAAIQVRYTPSPASTGSSSTSTSDSQASSGQSGGSATHPTPRPAGNSSAGTAHSSPVSAFGASGALGPGSSPNG